MSKNTAPVNATGLPIPTRRRALVSLAGLGAAVGLPAVAKAATAADPFLPLYAEAMVVMTFINRPDTGNAACEAGAERLSDIDHQVFRTHATTIPGAIASLEWARYEFGEHYDEGGQGDRLILSLINGALGVLRAQGGAA